MTLTDESHDGPMGYFTPNSDDDEKGEPGFLADIDIWNDFNNKYSLDAEIVVVVNQLAQMHLWRSLAANLRRKYRFTCT